MNGPLGTPDEPFTIDQIRNTSEGVWSPALNAALWRFIVDKSGASVHQPVQGDDFGLDTRAMLDAIEMAAQRRALNLDVLACMIYAAIYSDNTAFTTSLASGGSSKLLLGREGQLSQIVLPPWNAPVAFPSTPTATREFAGQVLPTLQEDTSSAPNPNPIETSVDTPPILSVPSTSMPLPASNVHANAPSTSRLPAIVYTVVAVGGAILIIRALVRRGIDAQKQQPPRVPGQRVAFVPPAPSQPLRTSSSMPVYRSPAIPHSTPRTFPTQTRTIVMPTRHDTIVMPPPSMSESGANLERG